MNIEYSIGNLRHVDFRKSAQNQRTARSLMCQDDGRVVAWGSSFGGGGINRSIQDQLHDVREIQATRDLAVEAHVFFVLIGHIDIGHNIYILY